MTNTPQQLTLPPAATVFLRESKAAWGFVVRFVLKPDLLREVVVGRVTASLPVVTAWVALIAVAGPTINLGRIGAAQLAFGVVAHQLLRVAIIGALLAVIGRENFRRSLTALLLGMIPALLVADALAGLMFFPATLTVIVRTSLIALYAYAALPGLRLPGHPLLAYGVLALGITALSHAIPKPF